MSGAFVAYRALIFLRMGMIAGVASLISHKLRQRHTDTEKSLEHSLALRHFQTSSLWPVPHDYQRPVWKIRNNSPGRSAQLPSPHPGSSRVTSSPPSDGPRDMAPWLTVDFKVDPAAFCEVVKQYCWEGNVESQFVVQRNSVRLFFHGLLMTELSTAHDFQIRDWYHAPWLHYTTQGREPLNGLTFERSTPPFDLSKTQRRYLQIWACGYYNAAGMISVLTI